MLYAVFGSSRQLSVGPESTTALMTATAVAPLAAGDPGRYAALAAALAVVVGLLCLCWRGPSGSASSRTCCPGRCSSAIWRASR